MPLDTEGAAATSVAAAVRGVQKQSQGAPPQSCFDIRTLSSIPSEHANETKGEDPNGDRQPKHVASRSNASDAPIRTGA